MKPDNAPGSRKSLAGFVALIFSFGVSTYDLFLVERKYSPLLARGAFLSTDHLAWWQAVLFVALHYAEMAILSATAATIIEWPLRKIFRKRGVSTLLAAAIPALLLFVFLTIEFEALRRFRDSLDYALLIKIGGGLKGSLLFIDNELVGLGPAVLAACGLACLAAFVVHRKYAAIGRFLDRAQWAGALFAPKWLLAGNLALIGCPALLVWTCPSLHHALTLAIGHRAYTYVADRLTDFDRDGYGLIERPTDFAPFDASRHPYALEIPGNGIDEDGIGGDLPAAITWNRQIQPWDGARLDRRSVVLVVLESARADLLQAERKGRRVMPKLRDLPGQSLRMISHAGFTVPSLYSAFTGGVGLEEQGISLVHRFRALGYATAVFSGQDESLGDLATATRMRDADVFRDAATFPADARLYSNRGPAGLAVTSRVTTRALETWLKSVAGRPFFAYINFQEMHFPYAPPNTAPILLARPVPRAEIVPENKEWLRDTYFNTARQVDEAVADLFSMLGRVPGGSDAVMLVTGDHGEELFDSGYLGHGINVSYEQNSTIGKLINSPWRAPQETVSQSDIPAILYNALARDARHALPLQSEALCFVGSVRTPRQVGLVSADGIVKYDFRKNSWSRQAALGAEFTSAKPDSAVIHKWESYLVWLARQASPGRNATVMSDGGGFHP